MSDSEVLELSDMIEKQKQAYKAFHQQYIDSIGKPAEMSDIIRSIMNKAHPPVPPKMVEQSMARE